MKEQNYHKHISAKHNFLDLKIKETWQYRDLIALFAKRTVQVKYKQTALGYAWLFISPLIASLIFWFVFGGIAFQKKCLAKMHEVAKQNGRTVLYVSHNMNTIRDLCDR